MCLAAAGGVCVCVAAAAVVTALALLPSLLIVVAFCIQNNVPTVEEIRNAPKNGFVLAKTAMRGKREMRLTVERR